jgi:hypothetical protein
LFIFLFSCGDISCGGVCDGNGGDGDDGAYNGGDGGVCDGNDDGCGDGGAYIHVLMHGFQQEDQMQRAQQLQLLQQHLMLLRRFCLKSPYFITKIT